MCRSSGFPLLRIRDRAWRNRVGVFLNARQNGGLSLQAPIRLEDLRVRVSDLMTWRFRIDRMVCELWSI